MRRRALAGEYAGRMNPDLSWDEFRLVKSIADARSLVGAAERLGVNQSTVYRRLAAVEAAVGARLFDRSRAGYEPTSAGEDMIALAATMAASIVEFERRVAGRDVKLTGELSVTVPIGIGLHFMPPIVAGFQASNPGVIVELILSNDTLDLSRRGADVAVRLTNDPPETLVGRKYAPPDGASIAVGTRRTPTPRRPNRWRSSVMATRSGPRRAGGGSRPMSIRDESPPGRIRPTACSSSRARGSARRCCRAISAISSPDLVRVGYLLPELDAGLWTLTHADLRRAARVRAFMDFAAAELIKHRRVIEGEEV